MDVDIDTTLDGIGTIAGVEIGIATTSAMGTTAITEGR